MNRTRTRALLGCILVGGTIAATNLPSAHADSDTFLAQVYQLGFTSPAPLLMRAGYGVCLAYENGANGLDVARYLYTHTDFSVTEEDAANFVIAATENLCPNWDHRKDITA